MQFGEFEHESRVHLDIETDNIPAEVVRLEKLGARVVDRLEQWLRSTGRPSASAQKLAASSTSEVLQSTRMAQRPNGACQCLRDSVWCFRLMLPPPSTGEYQPTAAHGLVYYPHFAAAVALDVQEPCRECAEGGCARSRASRRVSCSARGTPCNAVAHEPEARMGGRSLLAGGQRRSRGSRHLAW